MGYADDYEAVIGLEVHVQLKTRAKLFCGCANVFGAPPNTLTCPICLGHPGTLPTLNRAALRQTVKAALALYCEIPPVISFDRKNYFYPDLPKGFQISQHFSAVGVNGRVEYWSDDGDGAVGVERVQLEEDVARAVHDEPYVGPDETLLDFNRAGVPLMEVVSRPEIRSPATARRYLVSLRQTLIEAGVSDCDLEKGAFRIDTNISVRKKGEAVFNEQVEIKNLNSLRAMEAALEYEFNRQVSILARGGTVARQTLLYDEERGETRAMRAKEVLADYRYFTEPDLMPVAVPAEFIAGARAELGPPPAARVIKLRAEYRATLAEAELVAFTPGYYEFLTAAAEIYRGDRRALVNWLVGDVTRELNERRKELAECKLTPVGFAGLLWLLDRGELNVPAAREVLNALLSEGGDPAALVRERGLGQISDVGVLEALVREACAANAKAVADIKAGRDKARAAIVGYVMKKTRGRANPAVVQGLLNRVIAES